MLFKSIVKFIKIVSNKRFNTFYDFSFFAFQVEVSYRIANTNKKFMIYIITTVLLNFYLFCDW